MMQWTAKPRPEWHGPIFPLVFPIELDNGLRVLWERVWWKLTVTEEWAGMGADGWRGYTEYRDAAGNILGRVTHS